MRLEFSKNTIEILKCSTKIIKIFEFLLSQQGSNNLIISTNVTETLKLPASNTTIILEVSTYFHPE